MGKNELTTEDITGVFECCYVKNLDCDECHYNGDARCGQVGLNEVFELIQRLQGENAQIKKWYDTQSKLYNNLQEESQMQKAEIERLTEKSSYQRLELCKEIAALKKQVDEWTNTASKWFKRELELMDEVERAKGKTVKEVAQEALETFICRLVNLRLVSTKGDLYVEMLELKDDLLKEKYGVEDKQ